MLTLEVKMFNGTGYIKRTRKVYETLLENISHSVIKQMEEEYKATAISWGFKEQDFGY